ncbi:MAG: isocitrate lyase/phosphoenolpyruvate mutase family protein, partial [Rhizobiales bacterium]|nr:isocitrate lyase/phosphoenolpyruvate mutase family protein [Hyphomicrobiales bacterium]
DAGSAKLLEHLGFEALATTSLGVANMHGQIGVSKAQVLENVSAIAAATSLPVNADLEDGFATAPGEAAAIIPAAFAAGAVGGSIEDSINLPANRPTDGSLPILDFGLAVERVQAAVEAARQLPIPFMVTARAEGMLHGQRDLGDIIRRLQAFEAAGADVLYAPGLRTIDQVRQVTAEISKPFNMVMGFADPSITLEQLAAAGVQRVSIGGGLSRIALNAMRTAAREMQAGSFTFLPDMIPVTDLHKAFR